MWSTISSALLLASSYVPSLTPFTSGSAPSGKHQIGPIAHGGAWRDAFLLAQEAVEQMSIEEKVNLTSSVLGPCPSNSGGVPRLNITGMCFDDGPAGPRYTDFVTQWPSAFFVAASFDKELIYERAKRIGQEFRGKGINVALAPVTGGPLGRSPYAGRNWEAFSPDPYLSMTLSGLTVRGMQESGLITCSKHYILYEQEAICSGQIDVHGRTGCIHVTSEVDDKTFKELYLPTFAETVRAGTGAMMCSYNVINGTASCENSHTMNTILKDELNFQGFVLSDYGATHSTVPSAMGGMDMELPAAEYYGDHLLDAVKDGQVPIPRLDDMVHRILTPWYASRQHIDYPRTNMQVYTLQDNTTYGGRVWHNQHVDVRGEDHLQYSRKVATESHVLLKNSGVLPLKKSIRRIGIFGSDADYPPTLSGCGPDLFCTVASDRRYWNGTVTIGGGSGAAYADYIIPPLEAISIRARSQGVRVDYLLHDDSAHFEAMAYIASQSEVCLVFVSVFLQEGVDRESSLKLDHQGEELIKQVERNCMGEVVVVMHVGGQVVVEDWIDLPKIGGVVFAGYPGQDSGNPIADILWGDVNPSGKLPFTMGKSTADWPTGNIVREGLTGSALFGTTELHPRAVFSEGLAIDYKWFDKWNIEPRYEFGFGLSYTSFEMAGLQIKASHQPVTDTVQATNEKHEGEAGLYDYIYIATVNVTNTGKVGGAEVAQLYVSYPETEVEQPPKHLRGYDKVYLEPGQTATATFRLRKKDLSVWNVKKQLWHVPTGEYTFSAGSSSRDLPLKQHLSIDDAP